MEEAISEEVLETMGISRPVYEELTGVVGHLPTIDEVSTLLAMWESNGRQQGLLTWLKGQFHAAVKNEYLYNGEGETHKNIREPKVKDCLDIARQLFPPSKDRPKLDPKTTFTETGLGIYMVGKVSTEFIDSEYGRKCLHIVDQPISMGSVESDNEYTRMILDALKENGILKSVDAIERGGIFNSLLKASCPMGLGFDILTCREIRLDAFLFGEESGRFLVSLEEKNDDFFLLKLDEAGINCCFLGRSTKGRVLVDGMDYGPSSDFGVQI